MTESTRGNSGESHAAACGDERPHAAHSWHGVAKLEVGTKYGDDWQCPGVSAASKRERNTLRSMRLWREGRHWQAERGPLAAWVGIANDRMMVGLIWNHEARSLGVGLGLIYAGIGASYDR